MDGIDEEKQLEMLHARLEDIAEGLYLEEMEVLVEVAEGIAIGQERIGPFDLANDDRDLVREWREEERDELVYRAGNIVRERIRRRAREASKR